TGARRCPMASERRDDPHWLSDEFVQSWADQPEPCPTRSMARALIAHRAEADRMRAVVDALMSAGDVLCTSVSGHGETEDTRAWDRAHADALDALDREASDG